MRVLVSRGAADRKSPEVIVDPLCTLQTVGVERGKAYLYDEGYNKREYVIESPYRKPMYPANTITVHEGSIGESFVGRIMSQEILVIQENGAVSISSAITVERSDEII
jgi:hypothetical protein